MCEAWQMTQCVLSMQNGERGEKETRGDGTDEKDMAALRALLGAAVTYTRGLPVQNAIT